MTVLLILQRIIWKFTEWASQSEIAYLLRLRISPFQYLDCNSSDQKVKKKWKNNLQKSDVNHFAISTWLFASYCLIALNVLHRCYYSLHHENHGNQSSCRYYTRSTKGPTHQQCFQVYRLHSDIWCKRWCWHNCDDSIMTAALWRLYDSIMKKVSQWQHQMSTI